MKRLLLAGVVLLSTTQFTCAQTYSLSAPLPLLSTANTWALNQSFTDIVSTNNIESSGNWLLIASDVPTNKIFFKNGYFGQILLQMGGTNADIEPGTDIQLPGGAWGSGNLINNLAPIYQNSTFTGTTTAPAASFGAFLQQYDNSSNTNGIGFYEHLIANGSSVVGTRGAGMFLLDIAATTGNTVLQEYVGLTGKCNLMATDGPGPTTANRSVCFASNPVAHIGANVLSGGVVGEEIDTWIESGASVLDRIGLQIVDVTGTTYGTQATRDDVSLTINNQYSPSSTLGFKVGLEFGRTGGNFPVATNGTLIYGQANGGGNWTVANGIDWHLGTVTGNWLNLGGKLTVDGSGNTTVNGTLNVAGVVSGTGFTNLLTPYALINSPTFTGAPSAPTPASTDNSTTLATTQFVVNKITAATTGVSQVVGSSGNVTLAELVAGGVAPLAGPAFTGNVTMSGALGVTGVATFDNALNIYPTSGNSQINTSTINGGSGNLFFGLPTGALFRIYSNTVEELEVASTGISTLVPLNINAPAVVSDSYGGLIHENVAVTGTSTSGQNYLNLLQAGSDTVADNNLTILGVNDSFGGATMTGSRNTLTVNQFLTATSGNTSSGTQFSGLQIYNGINANDNGTAVTPAGAKGAVWGINTFTSLAAAATNVQGVIGYEMDIYTAPGSSVLDKIGLAIDLMPNDAAQGARVDDALTISGSGEGSPANAVGWSHFIDFGSANGHFPGNANTTMMFAQGLGGTSFTAANGIDWHLGNITGNWLNMGGKFIVDGSGNTTVSGALNVSGSFSSQIGSSIIQSGAVCNGSTDDTALINTYLASFINGGSVYVPSNKMCVINSGNLVIPKNVRVTGAGNALSFMQSAIANTGFLLNPAYTVTLGGGASLEHLAVIRNGLNLAPTDAQMFAALATWGSEYSRAITVTNGGTRLEHLFIEGFNTAVYINVGDYIVNDVVGDTYNGVMVVGGGDNQLITDTRFEPFLCINSANCTVGETLTTSTAQSAVGTTLQFAAGSVNGVQVGDYVNIITGVSQGFVPLGDTVASVNNTTGVVTLTNPTTSIVAANALVSIGGAWARPGVAFYISGGVTGWYCERCFSFMYRGGMIIDGVGVGNGDQNGFEWQHQYDPGSNGIGTIGTRLVGGSAGVSLLDSYNDGYSIGASDENTTHYTIFRDIALGSPDFVNGVSGPANIAGFYFRGKSSTPVIETIGGGVTAGNIASVTINGTTVTYTAQSGDGAYQVAAGLTRAVNMNPILASNHIAASLNGATTEFIAPAATTLTVTQSGAGSMTLTQSAGSIDLGSWGSLDGYTYLSNGNAIVVDAQVVLPIRISGFSMDNTGEIQGSIAIDPTSAGSVHLDGYPDGATSSVVSNLSLCGTTPTIATNSKDNHGTITEGTTATGCTFIFSKPMPRTPTITITNWNNPTQVYLSNVTATGFTVVNASASGDTFTYTVTP